MLLSNAQDIELLNLVKEKNSSEALEELVNRHSGIYISVVQRYSYVPHFERQELLDHRMANIYSYILDFDTSKGCKFSSFIGDRIKWKCKSLVNKYPEPENISESVADESSENPIETEEIEQIFLEKAAKISDPRFQQIFSMRIAKPKPASWEEIGRQIGISNEGARKIFYRNMRTLKNQITIL